MSTETSKSNTIAYIRFVDDDKKYELHEFKNKIISYNIHEIELLKTGWKYNKFFKIVHIFLISDLISIIFDYSLDVLKLSLILGTHNEKPEMYFFTDVFVYNFFVERSSKYIISHGTSCTIMYNYIKKNKHSGWTVICDCGFKHTSFEIRWCNEIAAYTSPSLPVDARNNAYSMCTIFKSFL